MSARASAVLLAALALAAPLAGCGLSRLLREARSVERPALRGELVVEGPKGERASFVPDACVSGEHESFRGFVLTNAPTGATTRAVVDPLGGGGVRLSGLRGGAPGELVVRSGDCETFELRVDNSGWRVNDFEDVGGFASLRCVTAQGWRVAGRLEVEHCH